MADYTDNGLKASIKALSEVIRPALDRSNPLAFEQLGLVIGFLQSLRKNLPHIHERDYTELAYYLGLARRLESDACRISRDIADALAASIKDAELAIEHSPISKCSARRAIASLTAAISALVRAAAREQSEIRDRVEREVLASARSMVTIQRCWFSERGFELYPSELPSLENALDLARAPQS
jgi:hypothetical protein